MMFGSLVTLEHRDPDADVLVVTNGWPHEGDPAYCIFVKRQVTELRAQGLRCDVLFIRGYRTWLAYVVAAALLLAKALSPGAYRLVHAHSGEAALAASFYFRAPVIASYLGDDLLGRPGADGSVSGIHRAKRQLIRQHSRLLARTITKTAAMGSALPRGAQKRNTVIPSGVDGEVFQPRLRSDARAHLGWDDSPVVLFVANLGSPAQAARKRPWIAEEAIALVRRSIPAARLHIVSRSEPDRVAAFMNAADCLVVCSSLEGSPNVVKEALMCNLPVVTTDVGDVRSLLLGVRPSWVVGDAPERVADGLIDCLKASRRSNGREHSSHLDGRIIAQRVLDVYSEAMREPASRTWATTAPEPNCGGAALLDDGRGAASPPVAGGTAHR